jgi:tetratricopeptide (TPR) repeat protein
MCRWSRALLTVCLLATAPLHGQTFHAWIARGDSLLDALMPAAALEAYRQAFQTDPTSYVAMWKFARAQADVAKQLTDRQSERRDSLYGVARSYAEAAVSTDPTGAEGHFQLSVALGRLSRTKGGAARVQFAREIYNEAARALELDPTHDGAHHVLGAWHAEVLRLSGLARFFATTFLGGGFMQRASWDSAVAHLERAVDLRPGHIYHRLELAHVFADLERVDAAEQQLEQIARLPPMSDVMDPEYKEEAAELLARLRGGGTTR